MQTRKPTGLASLSGLMRLLGHATMGVALGLAFALILTLIDPDGIPTLVEHGGAQAIAVSIGSIVLTFATGATLTGAVFIMTEEVH
jgi:hypothetical protein